jgi:hypothetical protein
MKLDVPNVGIGATGLDFRLVNAGKHCSGRIIPDLLELLCYMYHSSSFSWTCRCTQIKSFKTKTRILNTKKKEAIQRILLKNVLPSLL